MSSTGVNVLRWSALAVGVFYGFFHQRTIRATQRVDQERHEYERKQKLIDQAKAEFARQKASASASGDDVVTDIENPKFDLEKYLQKVSKENF